MEIVVREGAVNPALLPVEIVERKGLGHPDTICDAISESVSRALCHEYVDRFGTVLHHNVDKVLLVGGGSEPRLGGGHITRPAELYIAGRATSEWTGHTVPVADIAFAAAREWLGKHMRPVFGQQVRIIPSLRATSSDLRSLFIQSEAIRFANDTSCGAGFAPLSPLERLVLAVEGGLNDAMWKGDHRAIGEDIKVMAVRTGADVTLTIACAVVDHYVDTPASYDGVKAVIARRATVLAADAAPDLKVAVTVNAADGGEDEARFITVSGTSAEAGDDGETGRGNRVNGLITPYRPMTMEAAAGKNPVTHVGKLYQLMASDIAARIALEASDIRVAQCTLVSQIGRSVDDPLVVDIAVDRRRAEQCEQIRDIAMAVLTSSNAVTEAVIRGERRIF